MKTLHTIYNNFAKTNLACLRLLLVMFVTLMVSANAWGADVTFTANQDKGSTTNTSADNMTKSDITISSTSAGLAYSEYRFYNGTITISSTVGNITKIVFTCTSSNYATVLGGSTASAGSLSVSGSIVTWTGSSSSFTIRNTAQTRASKIVVTTASSTPTLTTTTSEIDFSNVAINSTSTQTFTFSGSNLTADATLAITGTNKSYFSVNTTNVPHSSGSISNKSITVTYEPTAVGEHTATLTISSSGATSKTITLNGNALQEHTVRFFSGGEEVLSKNILSGSTIGTLPSATSCDLTNFPHFVGWTESIIDGTTTTKPAIITTSTTISSNKEYHAVFADKEESTGSGTTGSTTFAPKGSSKSSPWSDNGSTWTFSNITFENSVSAGFPKNGTATVTLPTGAVANTITITRTSNSWSGKISLLVKTGSTTIQTLTQPSTTTTINLTSANQKNTYTFSHNNAATNVAYVDNIKVNYTIPATPTTVTYITSCSTEKVVTLQPNGGTGTAKVLETTDGSLMLPECDFTYEGYRFVGWNTKANGTGTTYQPSAKYTPIENPATLYAKWAKEYTVTYNANGGTTTCTDNNKYIAGEQVTVCTSTPTKNGYNFNGWSYAPNVTITSGTFTMPESNVTITAQWTAIEYTITYNDTKGAANANPTTYTVEDEITFAALTNLPKGYNFTGWNPASIAKGTTGNQTVTAQWTEKALTGYRTDCDACMPLDGFASISGTYHFFPGETITLTVTPPADAVPYTYQWQKLVGSDWTDIAGATTTTYTKDATTIEDAGKYRCVVSTEDYCDAIAEYNVKCLQLYVYYDNKSDVFNAPLKKGEGTTATINIEFQNANYTYYFKITDGCGNWYGFNGDIHSEWCTDVLMDADAYCGLKTTKFGTYVFNVNYSDLAKLKVSIIYPSAYQAAGKVIYLDNNVLKWTNSNNAEGKNKIYYRIGRSNHNSKHAMTLVPGTANLYKVTTGEYDNFDVWHIANNGCWSDGNSIYKTKTGDDWAATQATAFETLPVTLAAVTVTPTDLRSKGGDENNNNCDFYNYDITEGMKTWNAEVVEPTNGTITVKYTHHDGTAVSDFTSGDRDLAHTCLLTITATANEGYSLASLTVNDVPFTSGNIHTLTEDAVIKAEFTINTHTVTWNPAGGNWGGDANNIVQTYEYDELIEAPEKPVCNGYEFVEWSPTYTADMTMPDEDLVFTAIWNALPTYTVTWMVNGDELKSGVGGDTFTTNITSGNSILDLPDEPDAPAGCFGKVFVGWITEETYTEPTKLYKELNDFPAVTENVIYYAVWADETLGSGSGAEVGTVLWAENFQHFGTKTPSAAGVGNGTTVYGGSSITYSQSNDNTKAYNATFAGGASPELLLSKADGCWYIYNVPVGGAQEMSLSFKSNKTTFSVTVSNSDISVSGSQCEWTLENSNISLQNCTITIKNTSNSENARIDDVQLIITKSGTSSSTTYSSYTTICTPAEPHTVTWMVNGEKTHSQSGEVGTLFTDIPEPAGTDCDNDKVFVGWTATPIVGSTDTEPNDLFSSTEAASKTIPENNVTYYAVFANEGSGSGGDFSLGQSGNFKIYAIVNGISYYAKEDTDVDKIPYTTDPDEATIYTFTKETIEGEDYYTIFNGSKYIGYSGNSTSLKETDDAEKQYWSIVEGTHGSWRVTSKEASSRALAYRANGTNTFRAYSTSNINGTEYYDLEIGGGTNTTYSDYVTSCCQQPINPLTVNADKTELVKSGVVTLTATGGNGRNITWTTTGGVLSNQSNTGATLTISDVDATQNITVTATQAENNDDDLVCAQEVSIDITVKAQWTITFWTNDNGEKESNSMTVTDGESYTMPDISEEYVCTAGSSFVGWVDKEDDTELDAMPNSTQTATADQTWYAAWSSSSATETVDVYQLVTDVANLAVGDKVWITDETPTVAMGIQNNNNRGQVSVVAHPTENDKIYSTDSPATLTIGKDGDNYTFYDDDDGGYLYAASSSSNYLKTKATLDDNGKWSISITDGKASIIAQGTNTRNTIRYNQSNNPPLFSCYASGQKDVKIYKHVGTSEIEVSGATINTNNTSCTRGAVISAENGKWVTSANGQKVRIVINVTARGFESDATLSATSANEHFSVVSITNTTITKNSAFETQMMIEYQPAEANTNENAEITLVAKNGEEVMATRTIDVNGRSLPDEFVIVAQYNDKWLALPANMQGGADQYNGIEVTPNSALTQIPAAPNTTIYSLRGVAETRYETAGVCVRLVGNDNKCLWGNTSNTTTTIQNWTTLSKDNGKNYEWLLTTSDGEQYTIACPAHPEYSAGRVLANSGQKFGLYKGTTNFYILPVGCSALPGNVQVSPRRVDANFAWVSNASRMQIDVWTNEEMTEGKITQSTANSQYFFSGLKEKTQYWYKLTPDGNATCAVTGTFTTTGPTIDVVEWKENAVVIQVDKDDALNPLVIIDGEVEHGVGGTKATDIFFSKYFEAQGTAKLLAIYNGTANAISLSDIQILHRDSKSNTPLSLATFGKTKEWIQPGEEVILYNVDSRDEVMKCAKADDTFESWNNVEDNNLAFSGKGTIRLFRGSKCIDIIGAMEDGGDINDINDKTVKPKEGTETPGFDGDATGFSTSTGDYYKTVDEEKDYALSTNRCLLVRKPSVTSGAIAVEKNIGDFKTLGNDYDGIANEWAGLQVPNGPSSDEYKYTCEGFQEVGSFDYNEYYKEYNTIDNDTYLEDYSHDVNTNEYTIPIENLANYSCLNLRFQLKKDEEVLTETPVQVPIIVSGQKTTNDAIFNAIVKTDADQPVYDQSIERCKTCNVVVLSEATLTKATDETTNDVAQVHNVKVYPGGKLVIPEGTNYNVNSLSFRRQEEEVASAELKGNLNITASSEKPVYADVRVNAENWHWFTLPYDCNIADVTWVDGTPAKYGVDWFLSTYDGEKRADTQSGGCWAEFHGETIKAGVGYIVGIAGHPTKSKVKYELRFPMSKKVLEQEVAGTDKTVPVYAWGVDENIRPTHKGWNIVGNPYLDYYQKNKLNSFGGLRLGGKYVLNQSTGYWEDSGEWDGETSNLPYVVVPIDGGWSAYDQVLVSSIDLMPFTAYFVQVGNNPETEDNGDRKDVMFDGDNRGRASIARRAPSSVSEQEEPVIVGVSLTNSKGEADETSLVIDNQYTDKYEMNADFFKWFGDYYRYYTKPVVYTIGSDKEKRAFNALPEELAALPVSMGTYTAQNGEYTFSLDRRSDLTRVKEVWLHDATEGAYVNLMQGDYTFTSGKTDGTGRFTLAVTLHPKSPTDITDGMNGQVYVTSQQRMLYVNNLPQQARVWVYDAVGRLLAQEQTSAYQRAYKVGQAGVYFVRVESETGVETLQAIVE